MGKPLVLYQIGGAYQLALRSAHSKPLGLCLGQVYHQSSSFPLPSGEMWFSDCLSFRRPGRSVIPGRGFSDRCDSLPLLLLRPRLNAYLRQLAQAKLIDGWSSFFFGAQPCRWVPSSARLWRLLSSVGIDVNPVLALSSLSWARILTSGRNCQRR